MHSLADERRGFASIYQDGKPKVFVFVFSCGHAMAGKKPPLHSAGLKGTFAYCKQHGAVTVRDVFPGDRVGLGPL